MIGAGALHIAGWVLICVCGAAEFPQCNQYTEFSRKRAPTRAYIPECVYMAAEHIAKARQGTEAHHGLKLDAGRTCSSLCIHALSQHWLQA